MVKIIDLLENNLVGILTIGSIISKGKTLYTELLKTLETEELMLPNLH